MVFSKIITSPVGNIKLTTNSTKVIKISLTSDSFVKQKSEVPSILKELEKQLNQYFDRTRKTFNLELDFSKFSNLQKEIYEALIKTEYGKTLSYKELAEKANSKAYRAVGTFMAKNPFPILIPCHRVILSNKKMGNYSFGENNKYFFIKLESKI